MRYYLKLIRRWSRLQQRRQGWSEGETFWRRAWLTAIALSGEPLHQPRPDDL